MPAVLAGPEVGRERLMPGAVLAEGAQRRRKAVRRVAVEDRGEDRPIGVEAAESLDLLGDPERGGGAGGAKDDQGARLAERGAHRLAEVACRGQFLAVAEDGPE